MYLFQTTEGFRNIPHLPTLLMLCIIKSVGFQELHCLGFQCSLGDGLFFIHLKGVQQTSELSKYSERMHSYFEACKFFLRSNLCPERDAKIAEGLSCHARCLKNDHH